jgi:hypothetical protein
MTIVGSKRMVVYDDVSPLEKIRIFDARVERPPHYDTFAEFHYAYHYGDVYIPYLKQEEPLKNECQHFLDCIRHGAQPLTSGKDGLELVRILEASTESLKKGGAPVRLSAQQNGGNGASSLSEPSLRLSLLSYNKKDTKKFSRPADQKSQVKVRTRGR